MITEVSKYKAKHKGNTVRLKRASLKSYRGGEFYIRAYVGYSGSCGVEIVKVVGRPYKTKESRKYHKGVEALKITTYREPSWFRGSGRDDFYTCDLGLTANYAKCFHFSNEAYNMLKELVDNDDKLNLLKVLEGFSVEEAEESILDMKWQAEMDRQMEQDYYGGN